MFVPPRHDGDWGKHQSNFGLGEFAEGSNVRNDRLAKLLFLSADLHLKLALIAIS